MSSNLHLVNQSQPRLRKREVQVIPLTKTVRSYHIIAPTIEAIHEFIRLLSIPGQLIFNYARGNCESAAIFKTSHSHKLLGS